MSSSGGRRSRRSWLDRIQEHAVTDCPPGCWMLDADSLSSESSQRTNSVMRSLSYLRNPIESTKGALEPASVAAPTHWRERTPAPQSEIRHIVVHASRVHIGFTCHLLFCRLAPEPWRARNDISGQVLRQHQNQRQWQVPQQRPSQRDLMRSDGAGAISLREPRRRAARRLLPFRDARHRRCKED